MFLLLKKFLLTAQGAQAQFFPRFRGGDPSFGGTHKITPLNEEGFINVFDGGLFFADGNGNIFQSHRAAVEVDHDDFEDTQVHFVQSVRGDLKHLQCIGGDFAGDDGIRLDFGIIPGTAQKIVGDTGSSAASGSDFSGALLLQFHAENTGGTFEDAAKTLHIVIIQTDIQPETAAQRRGDHALTGGRTHQRETGDRQPHGTCARTLFEHDVDKEILHGTVKILFHRGIQTVDLVDEQHIAGFKGGEKSGEVAGFFDGGAAGTFQIGSPFVGDDVCQCGFAQSRRTAEQNVIQCLIAGFGGTDKEFQLLFDFILTRKIGKFRRPQTGLFDRITPVQCRCYETLCHFFCFSDLFFSCFGVTFYHVY